MSGSGASDASIVEDLKKSLMEYGSELVKPYDCTEVLTERLDVSFNFPLSEFFSVHLFLN